MKLEQAKEIAKKYLEILRPFAYQIEIAGSVRRKKPEVKDIEIVMLPMGNKLFELKEITDKWGKIKGDVTGKYCARILPEGIHLDLFFANSNNWFNILFIRTGSADWIKKIAFRWKERGYHSKDGLLHPITNCEGDLGQPIVFGSEEKIFEFLDMKYVPPEERN